MATRPAKPDPRVNPWRDDLAAAHLRGEVEAPRFVEGEDRRVYAPVTAVRRSPADGAMQDSQLLYGEGFRVYEVKNGWAWGQSTADDYVGYVLAEDLAAPLPAGHKITALRSFVYRDPDIKTRPLMGLSMGAQLAVAGLTDGFVELQEGGFVHAGHVGAAGDFEADPVAVARRFLGAAYFWGGRESSGLDCSALVQLALAACGRACPRDSDMQQAALGTLAEGEAAYGDLVFWKGHVGWISGDNLLLHANAHHMAVAEEPFDAACARIAASGGGPVTAVKRL